MNNGTIPLQIALKLLGRGGEIITTPFSYVATTAAIVWENCTPIFVDIDPNFLTIDEDKIEAAITDKTTCILATHVFGNPCNIERINQIAHKHNLKVIYDAAHCFGVKYINKSIFEFGDISTCSFHATKLFHTGEGGGLYVKSIELYKESYYSHNFGHNGPQNFDGLGINGKMSEIQAAMGLSVLPHMNFILKSRKNSVDFYDKNLNFSKLEKMKLREGVEWNFSYYPVIFQSESSLLFTLSRLNAVGIYPRRYFFPSLNKLPYVDQIPKINSESISSRILCLPLFFDMELKDLDMIVQIVNS
jgi:dTDP-4-amino-4,6-dideoxygalactose transaminase